MTTQIADTAWVDPRARLADGVQVGPYCVVGPDVRIGAGTILVAHVTLLGRVDVGARVTLGPFTRLGELIIPDHAPRVGGIQVADGCRIGGHVSIEPGIQGKTTLGAGCILVGQNWVGADTRLASEVRLEAQATVADRVRIGDRVVLGTGCTVESGCQIDPGLTLTARSVISADLRAAKSA